MSTQATTTYEITGWNEEPIEEPGEGPKLLRATVGKTFRGDLEGTSSAHLLMARGDDGEGYVAVERVTGVLGGREGSFVLQHGAHRALADDGRSQTFAYVVPGSGTRELEGLRGQGQFRHDEHGAVLTLTYELV
jgi:hypothetical protein